jgi:hypothetical protein
MKTITRRTGFFAAVLLGTILCFGSGASGQKVVPPEGYRGGETEEGKRERFEREVRTRIARVRYGGGGDWYSDPSSLTNLLEEFERRTGIPTAKDEKVIELGDPELSSFPFLYMTGHGNVHLTGEEQERLRNHLLGGGFLYADDNYGMDRSFRRMIAELFPELRLVTVPLDHAIYSSFYRLDGPPKIHEHDGKPPEGLGIFDAGRLMVFYTYESDIGDGLEDPDVHGDPPGKREVAFRMAVNILFYALTR